MMVHIEEFIRNGLFGSVKPCHFSSAYCHFDKNKIMAESCITIVMLYIH